MASITEVLGTDIAHVRDFLPSPSGDFDRQSGLENLRNALFHRLVTEPGTLVFRPTYGVGIKQWLNAPATLQNEQSLAQRIEEQFLREVRVSRILGVTVNRNDSRPDLTTVVVRVLPVGYDEVALTFVPFGDTV